VSPFRPAEKTPSFKIDPVKNLWFDFGSGEGGTIIDFVQKLYKLGNVSQTLATISDLTGIGFDPILGSVNHHIWLPET
jgi:CHC2 zinc finger